MCAQMLHTSVGSMLSCSWTAVLYIWPNSFIGLRGGICDWPSLLSDLNLMLQHCCMSGSWDELLFSVNLVERSVQAGSVTPGSHETQ